jgi:hypothetical protein
MKVYVAKQTYFTVGNGYHLTFEGTPLPDYNGKTDKLEDAQKFRWCAIILLFPEHFLFNETKFNGLYSETPPIIKDSYDKNGNVKCKRIITDYYSGLETEKSLYTLTMPDFVEGVEAYLEGFETVSQYKKHCEKLNEIEF